MAASSARRSQGPCRMLAFVLLITASLLNTGVTAEEENVVATTAPPVVPEDNVRGDMVPQTPEAPVHEDPQVVVYPTMAPQDKTEQTTAAAAAAAAGPEETGVLGDGAAPEEASEEQTTAPKVTEPESPAPLPPRGDGPANKPQLVQQDDVVCVSKEAVQEKNAVNAKLKASSSCENTKAKFESVRQELCGDDCKLEIFQEENSDEIIVSGKYVEADVSGMANKLNNEIIKEKTGVENAVPRWGKNSKLVLVSLLLTGLLLAALLVAGYYLKTHRKNSKGVRLAESFQVDEENQANTLVSVAPLPQEPLDKPTVNDEPAAAENGTNPAPTTNGHSAGQTPVADTEM